MNSKVIRQKYFDFFQSKQHKLIPSAPMVVKNDPTLLFTNAGMNQFKPYFLGDSKSDEPRLVNSQKCLRVSGKHNDLEEVGVDTYHHTMFEMLGNWSFNDYFKKEAIQWAWELLTKIYGLDQSRIYITIFKGDKKDNLSEDSESYKIWKEIVVKEHILKCDKKDNFWEMGNTGPCGPCSEIHIDLRSDIDRDQIKGNTLINKDHPLVVEVWNLVFMEYNRRSDGTLIPLVQKHIDTGLGLERLCMVLQNKTSNYDTDLFQPLINKVEKMTSLKYNIDRDKEEINIAMRVIADHIRAITFSIADGQLPSNTGAGYVIRRILRRAVRYGYQTLNLKEPFLYNLVELLAEQFEGVYSEIKKQQSFIEKVIKEEEITFFRTLEQGLKKIDKICVDLKNNNQNIVSGHDTFELYDRYGFPIDLTHLIAKGYNMSIDEKGFNDALNEQKKRSKKDAESEKSDWEILIEDDKEEFIGYDYTDTEVMITRFRSVTEKGEKFHQLVFNITPFYPEGGGQIGDVGFIISGDKKTEILDTIKENELILHNTSELPSDMNSKFRAVVDNEKRALIANNHTATHLLHQALREVLGTHVEQKGSLVNDQYLRFDFSHFEKVSEKKIVAIERFVNKRIRSNYPLEEERNVPLSKAKELGAIMLFGEKYGEVVRVIKFNNSIELCGGIHVPYTSVIGNFKILNESSIAAGVRRIEAVTSNVADAYFDQQLQIVKEVKGLLKNPKSIIKSVKELIDQNINLQKKIDSISKAKAGDLKQELIGKKKNINGIDFIAEKVDLDMSSVKDLAFDLKREITNLFLVLAFEQKGKAQITVILSDNLVNKKELNAGKIVGELAKYINGRGGGQPFYATAGGNDPAGIAMALKKAQDFIV